MISRSFGIASCRQLWQRQRQRSRSLTGMSMIKYLVTKYLYITMVSTDTMGFRDTKVDNMYLDPNMLADTMTKSEYSVSKYLDTMMVSSNTMGIRVNIVDHMRLCLACSRQSHKCPKFQLEGLREIVENVAYC